MTDKQTTTSHSPRPVAALLTPSKSAKGSAAEVHRECTRDARRERGRGGAGEKGEGGGRRGRGRGGADEEGVGLGG